MKQIKKFLVALILVFALFLVACEECPECPECPTKEEICKDLIDPSACPGKDEVCNGLIDPSACPETPCPEVKPGEVCPSAGYIKPEDCPECPEGITAPESVEFYSEDVAVGEGVKFEVEVSPENAFQGLIWSTSDPTVATVAEDGTITGVRPGKVTITAKSALNAKVAYEEEVEVVEKGLLDYEIAEREKNAIVAALSTGYVSGDFDLPTTWNKNAVVTYTDANGKEIESFKMPDLGGATSQNYSISGNVTFNEAVAEFNVTLKLVAAAEGKNDYEKVDFAVEVAEAFLYTYLQGEKVANDVFLPVSVYGINLGWSTNKAYVLTNEGTLTRPNNDTAVNYTITPKCGAASKSKTFTVIAQGFDKEDKITYLKKEGVLADIVGKTFSGSIGLPAKDDKFGIHLTYTSSNPNVISDEGVIASTLNEKAKVTFTVTAVYEDLNSASDAFVEVFTFDVYAAAQNNATNALSAFVESHPQFAHIPWGMTNDFGKFVKAEDGTEHTYVITPEFAAANPEFTFAGDENFQVNKDGSVELVTQYFRYHEAKLTATAKVGEEDTAEYVWTINVGIGAVNDIVYIGGRSQSLQASANPNERGDMLQGFSKWDKYVGIVSSNAERTGQQYWSEFSGYTMYVDVPTGEYATKFTKDAEGNVTVKALDTKAFTRHQIFFMEFAVIHVDEVIQVWAPNSAKNAKALGYLPRTNTKSMLRSTYGGNFGSFFVNHTDKAFDQPVSSLSMGGTFADGQPMKTFSKANVALASKPNAAADILDDYGNALKVSREQTWAHDGYRPSFVIQPTQNKDLAEGESMKYKFTLGVEDSVKNTSMSSSPYVQYGINSTLSAVWGTPYIVVPAYGMSMAFHSQTIYTFSSLGGAYICGGDKSLVPTVERYNRHPENEEVSDYIRNVIKSYYTSLLVNEEVTFTDISKDDLDKIYDLYNQFNGANGSHTLHEGWKVKEDLQLAGKQLAEIVKAAKEEIARQDAYAKLTVASFKAVEDEIKKLKESTDSDQIRLALEGADLAALIDQAERNYNALTPGQKGLYDGGYTRTDAIEGLTFEKRQVSKYADAMKLELDVIKLPMNVTNSNVASVKAALKAQTDLAEGTLAGSADKADTLLTAYTVQKLGYLAKVVEYFNMKTDQEVIDQAEADYAKLAADSQLKAMIDATFANLKVTVKDDDGNDVEKSGFEAKIILMNQAVVEANKAAADKAAADLKAEKAQSVADANALKEAINALPSSKQFEAGEFTDAQYNSMVAITKADGSLSKLASKVAKLKGVAAPTTNEERIKVLTEDFTEAQQKEIGNFVGEAVLLTKVLALPSGYDKYKADLVITAVEALPGAKVITLSDEAAYNAAKKAYDGATPAQKAIIDSYTSNGYINSKLEAALNAINGLKLAAKTQPVEIAINAIPATTTLKLEDQATVNAAKKAYDKLDAAAKAAILDASKAKLDAAVEKISALEEEFATGSETYKAAMKAFEKVDASFEVVVTAETKAELEALLAAFNATTQLERTYLAKAGSVDGKPVGNPAAAVIAAKIASALKVYEKFAPAA